MKPEYAPKSKDQILGYLVEECGEVLSAVGKAQRWGLDSANPELPIEEQETNAEWILRELLDLESAIQLVRTIINGEETLINVKEELDHEQTVKSDVYLAAAVYAEAEAKRYLDSSGQFASGAHYMATLLAGMYRDLAGGLVDLPEVKFIPETELANMDCPLPTEEGYED